MKKLLLTGLALLVASCSTLPTRDTTNLKLYEIKCENRESDPACYNQDRTLVKLEYRF